MSILNVHLLPLLQHAILPMTFVAFFNHLKIPIVNFPIKKENGLPVFDASREQEVIERNLEHIQNPDYKPFYKDFLHHVMENSKDYQKNTF